jgi:hypothetical protein
MLVAYVCKVSFQKGFDGFVAFNSKTKLIQHYEKTLGAYRLGGQRMIIPTQPAQILIDKYFKSYKMGFIKEPKGVDFTIQSQPLTDKDRIEISKFIRDYKAKSSPSKQRTLA